MKTRKTPLRKCTGCKEMKDKKDLIRIVRTTNGDFLIDNTLKQSGRGAYICKTNQCISLAKKNKGFERSFKSPVPSIIYESLCLYENI